MKQKKKIRKGMLGIILSFAMVLGLMPGMSLNVLAEQSPEDTLYFTDSSKWNIPTSATTTLGTYTDGTHSVKLYATGSYQMNSNYLSYGMNSSYLELPAFNFVVDKIVVAGASGASRNVEFNVFVGDKEASTAVTGATGTQTFEIKSDYQAASTVYKLKVLNSYFNRITKIEVYKKATPAIVEYPLWVNGVQVTSANASDVLANDPDNKGKVSFTPSEDSGPAILTLNGANITNSHEDAGIYYNGSDPLCVSLSGSTNVSGVKYGIYSNDATADLTITGEGSFTADVSESGIYSDGNIIIDGGIVNATSNGDYVIYSQKSITIKDGTVTIVGKKGFGIYVYNQEINIVGGKVTASGELSAFGDKKVKNAITGTGWTNVEGTQGMADIEISSEGQSLSAYKKVQFPGMMSVSYDGNGYTGGTAPVDAASYKSGDEVTVLGNTGNLVKTGCSFADWNSSADGTGETYASGSKFNITLHTKLFAQWKHDNTIYKAGDNFSIIDSASYKLGNDVFTGQQIKTNYQILVNELPIGGVAYNAENQCVMISFPNNVPVPIPAKGTSDPLGFIVKGSGNSSDPYYFEAVYDKCTVTYDGNGSTGGTAPVDAKSPYEMGETVTVLDNTGKLEKTDSTFDGWNTKADGTGTAYQVNDTFVLNENTTLYAQWIKDAPSVTKYTVKFDVQGHGTAPADQVVDKDSKATKPSDPAAEGYTFGGWFKEAACTNAWNFDTDTVTADTTLFAKWTKDDPSVTKYTVKFDVQGHGTAPADQVVDKGSKVTKPSDPAAEGYTFDGWFKEAACTNAWNFDTDTVTADTTLYAKWTKDDPSVTKYTVKFDVQGHGTAPADQVVDKDSKVSKPSDPAAEGYTFGGWFKEAACTNAWNFDTDTVTADITLYVKWTVTEETRTQEYKLTDKAISPELKEKGYDSIEIITRVLEEKLSIDTAEKKINSSVSDVVLEVSMDGGKTWVPATEENFPAEGIKVVLAFPKAQDGTQTNGEDYVFSVAHLVGTTVGTVQAGTIETPPVTVTDKGISTTFHGLSPVIISWEKKTTPEPTPTDTGVTLNLSETFLSQGMEKALKATTVPAGAAITWTSSDTKIAYVDGNGVVMGLKPGTATITAKITVDGKEYSASCKVTVVPAGTPIIIPSGGGEHTHKFVWNTIEATEDTDGELRYQCETCGEIQTRVPLTAYNVFNMNTTEKIRKAPKDATVRIETNKWISFHKMVMEALAERSDVTLEISFLDEGYKGKRCTVVIPKGTDTKSLVDKNGFTGFLFLGGKFGLKTD